MRENQSSKPALDSDHRTAQDSRIDDVDKPFENSAEPMTTEPILPKAAAAETESSVSQVADDSDASWASVPLPGTVDVASTAKIDAARENELLTLIHDLNDCNDVLLSRVSQLEAALGESQRMLKQAGEQSRVAKGKMAEQLSAEQLSAQQVSQNAQQQVATVVAQLETAEQSLQRQQLMSETLQSELNNAQERVSQLEHECALSAQQHAEEAQARVQAETTIRDLRSRLQRQQRYTLQFKAALEKSLTVTARSAASVQNSAYHRAPSATARPTAFSESATATPVNASGGVTMPKAQRIMPWAGAITSPFEGIDPHLESLIRGANTPNPVSASPASLDANADPSASDLLATDASSASVTAEDKLWQDMERVIEHSTEPSLEVPVECQSTESPSQAIVHPTDETPAADETPTLDVSALEKTSAQETPVKETFAEETPAEETPVKETSAEETAVEDAMAAVDTPPKLNWQRKVVPTDESDDAQHAESSSTSDSVSVEQEPLIQALGQKAPSDRAVVIDPYTVPVGQTPAAEVAFTEPSPWGKPLIEKTAVQAAASQATSLDSESAAREYLPAVEGEASAVAPTANPLRTQKKIGSMSAVQLPTFEKAKAGSFKR